jgi:hypothetical protein
MKRTATGLCVAAAMAYAVTLGAQTSATTAQRSASDKPAHDVTVTGCLAKDASGGYMLNDAKIDTGAASTTTAPGATTTAGSPPAAAASTTSSGPAMNWMLTGGTDLDTHVGHKIQVTGKTSWDSSMSRSSTTTAAGATTTATTPPTATGTTGAAEAGGRASHPMLDVESIKMVAASCS